MKTDHLFYRLFQEYREVVFELTGWPLPSAAGCTLHAEEVKQTSFRLDDPPIKQFFDFIETILIYKLPHLTREEIQAMLHWPEIDIKEALGRSPAGFSSSNRPGRLASAKS